MSTIRNLLAISAITLCSAAHAAYAYRVVLKGVTPASVPASPPAPPPAPLVGKLSLSVSTLNVGACPQAQTCGPQSATLTNSGTGPVGLTSIGLASGTVFGASNTCPALMQAGSSCDIAITFSPSAIQAFSDTLQITSDASPTAMAVPVTGTGGAPTYAILSSTDKSATLSVSSNSVSGTGSSSWGVVRANTARSSGKYVFEATASYFTASVAVGFATQDTSLTAQLGTAGTALGMLAGRSTSGSNIGYAATPALQLNTTIMVALDLDAGKGWIAQQGVWRTGNPVTGDSPTFTWAPGTTLAPAFAAKGSHSVGVNFGASAFTNTPPAGFNAGWF